MIYRRVNPGNLDAVRGDLDATVTQAGPRIEETAKPNVNCDSTEGDNRWPATADDPVEPPRQLQSACRSSRGTALQPLATSRNTRTATLPPRYV